MYVRLFRDGSGHIHLQQLLKLETVSKDGRKLEAQETWTNVATMGTGQSEAYDLPITTSCGVLLFNCKETIFVSLDEGHREVNVTYAVSVLDIYKITQLGEKLQLFTKDKLVLEVRMTYHLFMELLISLYNNFKLVKFDHFGRLIKE